MCFRGFAQFLIFFVSTMSVVSALIAGEWVDDSPPETFTKEPSHSKSSAEDATPKFEVYGVSFTLASTDTDSTECRSKAVVTIDTEGTWTGTHSKRTVPSASASFSGIKKKKHIGTPSHVGTQGTYQASGKVRVSFEANCFVRTNAQASCGGAASASINIKDNTGNAEITAINVGCTTAGTGYPIGFSIGGSVGGTGADVSVTGQANSASIYNSGLIFREYLFSTPDTPTDSDKLSVVYSGSTSASAAGTATPGFIYSSEAESEIETKAIVSDVVLDVTCPPPPPPEPPLG